VVFYKIRSVKGPLKKNEKKLARFFNITFRYIDDVISLNNSMFGDIVDCIYPIELEIKDTADTTTKHSKYVVNQKLEHVEDISFRDFLVESEWCFTNKICLQ
jgi:hypothetical protein